MRELHVIFMLMGMSWGLYSASSPVTKLTASNFKSEVLDSKDLWLVEFFAPWCGHCKNLAPIYEESARALSGIIKLGAVDMTTDQSAGEPYNISGFPTLKFFGDDKKAPIDYSGGRTSKEITSFLLNQAQAIVDKRTGNKSSSSSGNKSSQDSNVKDEDVVVLTSDNFSEEVLNSKDLWLVEFYAPWCGHCKKLAPEWAKAATMLKGSVKVGKVDATEEPSLAEKYGVKGYPTIKFFPPHDKSNSEEYNGPREAEGITRVAMTKLESYGILPDINQINNQEEFEKCSTKTVCLISFMPHIYDSSALERNRYIETVQKAASRNRSKPILFLWAQQGDFYKLEEKIGLGAGFPAVVAISMQKERLAVMRTKFTEVEIDIFISKVISGQYPLNPYKDLPKLKPVELWDGEDHQPEHDDL